MGALIKSCIKIFVFAAMVALAYNLFMPQGIGFMPEEISAPLWLEVNAEGFKQKAAAQALIIDARPAGEYNKSRIRGAVKLPVEELDALYPLLAESIKQAPEIIIYGRSLSRFPAARLGQFLCKQGINKVYVTEASLEELQKAGLSIQEPRRRSE